MIPFFTEMLTVFTFILVLPTSYELIHWILPVSVCIQLSKSDVDYGVGLVFP